MISLNRYNVLAPQQNNTNSNGNGTSGNNKTISITMTYDTQQQQNLYSMGMGSGLQNQNWSGSISLFSPILDMFKSKIHTSRNDATTSAINAVGRTRVGSNASAVAAFIHPENGFLVYDVFVLDSSNTIHRVVADPGNGRVLSNIT